MNRTIHRIAFVLVAALAVCGSERSAVASSYDFAGASLFLPEAYLTHIQYLASDELGGRLPGTEGGDLAAEYIAEQFRQYGLVPAGVDGTYFQPFEVRRLKNFDRDAARLEIAGIETELVLGEAWTPMPFTQPGDFSGPLAFAGFGIEAPDHDYNDYADFDARDKVVLVLRGEPSRDDPEAKFGGESPSSHALFSTKARVASEKGAKALLIVNDAARSDPDELYAWRARDTRTSYAIPMVHVSRSVAGSILQRAGMSDLNALETALATGDRPLSRDIPGVTVTARTGVSPVNGRNVLGKLPGDGTSNEIIVVGAHHDHIGTVPRMMRRDGEPEIHNGADDNASGTAGVLELARALACGPPMRRTILFMTFDAEELGLLGSRHFVANPTVDLGRIIAMINFDMIGRAENANLTVFGVPTSDEFEPILIRAARSVGLDYHAPTVAGPIFRQSDHASFYDADIPVMFASTMLHPQYHQPEDEWDLIDAEGAVVLLEAMAHVVTELANTDAGLGFVRITEERRRDSFSRAARRAAQEGEAEASQPAMPRVRLGIMPIYSDDGPGVLIDRVVEGTPAERAGMLAGDRIVRIGEAEVADMYGYMQAIRDFAPGASATIVVRRGEEEVSLEATFAASEEEAQPVGAAGERENP